MDDGTLISIVQNYEELYNLKHPDYSNQQRRDNIWEEIGKILKKPDKVCRERWTRLRDNHRKALQLRKTKSGQAATKIKPPKFDKVLTFLVSYLFDEETRHSKISSPTTLPNDNESQADDEAHIDQNNVTVCENISAPSSSFASTPVLKKRRIGSKKHAEEPSAASVLQHYLKTRKKTDTDQKSSQQIADDPFTAFFITMAQTAKAFPLRDQIEIKTKLFQMVNSVEMRIANELENPISYSPSTVQMVTANQVHKDSSTYYINPCDRYHLSQQEDSSLDGYFSEVSQDEFGCMH